MPSCIIDGKEAQFEPGENLIEIAKRIGVEIPYFCWHPGLTVVAQCRMCAVEIEGARKLATACSTEARDGMVVHTKSEQSKKNQESVMEFLLINHPLDCPICDKAGECDLQDHSFGYGSAYMRYTEERRTYVDLDMGPVIKKNMNRCIHCTRCIRFGEEVAGIREMVAVQRGNNTEITTINGDPLATDYAGNYADVCPTGSLTLKDFRFNKRAWFLKKTPTICEGCSRGCNMEIQQDKEVIHRCIPRENKEINKWWMCDEGRFNYHYLHSKERLNQTTVKDSTGQLNPVSYSDAMTEAKSSLKGKVAVLIGSDLTQEEAAQVQTFASGQLKGAPLFHFGTAGVASSKEDGDADKILKRKSKTANLHGLEKLGINEFKAIPSGTETVVVFRGGRAELPSLKDVKVIAHGVFMKPEASSFQVVFPGFGFAEKTGTAVNCDGIEQKFQKSIQGPRGASSVGDFVKSWDSEGRV